MQRLLNAVTATGDSATINVPSISRGFARSVQVSITGGTATVVVRGRSTSAAPWVDLATFSASGISLVSLPPQLEISVTAISGATVSAWVDGYTA